MPDDTLQKMRELRHISDQLRRTLVEDYRPFCSKRCADVDLNRWLAGNYVIPGRDGDRSASSRAEDPSEPDQG